MKKFLTTAILLVVTVCIAGITSCNKDTDDTPALTATTNHTVTINSNPMGDPVQFTSLKITPVDNSSPSVISNFVLNPNTEISVKINLPKTTSYKIEVISPSGINVFWNSIAMDANNGNTIIHLGSIGQSGYTDYCANSQCCFFPPDGC